MSDVDYSAYIQSDEWKQRRQAALWRSASSAAPLHWPCCEVCGRYGTPYKNSRSQIDSRDARYRVDGANGLNVHHLNYRNLGAETPADVIVLCTDTIIWRDSGYRDFRDRVGCHERAHDDADFRAHVERVAHARGTGRRA